MVDLSLTLISSLAGSKILEHASGALSYYERDPFPIRVVPGSYADPRNCPANLQMTRV